MPKAKKINGFDEWEAEGFADSIKLALEVISNPKKKAAAKVVLRRRARADKKALGWAGELK